MKLPIFDHLDRQQQTVWATKIEPTLTNPVTQGILLTNIPLAVGSNIVNHRLGRQLQGYIITGMREAFSQIYNTTSAMPDLTIVLQSSAVCTIDLYVF